MELGVAREHPVHMMDVAATPSCKQEWRMRLAGSVVSAGERHICSHTRGHFQHPQGTLSVGTRCFCSRTRQLRQHSRSTLMTDAKCICSWLETHYQHTRSMPLAAQTALPTLVFCKHASNARTMRAWQLILSIITMPSLFYFSFITKRLQHPLAPPTPNFAKSRFAPPHNRAAPFLYLFYSPKRQQQLCHNLI